MIVHPTRKKTKDCIGDGPVTSPGWTARMATGTTTIMPAMIPKAMAPAKSATRNGGCRTILTRGRTSSLWSCTNRRKAALEKRWALMSELGLFGRHLAFGQGTLREGSFIRNLEPESRQIRGCAEPMETSTNAAFSKLLKQISRANLCCGKQKSVSNYTSTTVQVPFFFLLSKTSNDSPFTVRAGGNVAHRRMRSGKAHRLEVDATNRCHLEQPHDGHKHVRARKLDRERVPRKPADKTKVLSKSPFQVGHVTGCICFQLVPPST